MSYREWAVAALVAVCLLSVLCAVLIAFIPSAPVGMNDPRRANVEPPEDERDGA